MDRVQETIKIKAIYYVLNLKYETINDSLAYVYKSHVIKSRHVKYTIM